MKVCVGFLKIPNKIRDKKSKKKIKFEYSKKK